MIESFCDRDEAGVPVTRQAVVCPRCEQACQARAPNPYGPEHIGRDVRGLEPGSVEPYTQWRVVGWIRRMIESGVPREIFADRESGLPEGWVPRFCPSCEHDDLRRGEPYVFGGRIPTFRPIIPRPAEPEPPKRRGNDRRTPIEREVAERTEAWRLT